MQPIIRYFSFDDVTASQGWDLLSWCRSHGADDFSLTALVSPVESGRMKAFFARLDVYSKSNAVRHQLAAAPGEAAQRDTRLWRLTEQTEAILRESWGVGFVSNEYDVDLWLEDLAVYRAGDLMMGVVSHENGGVLRLTELELSELRHSSFPDRDSIPWIGF